MAGEQEGGGNVEQEARGLGWVPKEEFRGDPERWVDADTFVERGHTVMPILKSQNKRLEDQLKTQAAELTRMQGLLAASQESIQALQEVHADATKAAVAKAKKDLLERIKEARETGDVDVEMELTDELTDLKAQEKAAPAKPAAAAAPGATGAPGAATPQIPPEMKAWMEANPWFGVDQRKTLRVQGIAQELRSDPEYDSLQGKAFFDKIMEVLAERTGAPVGKVGEGRPSGGGGSGSGRRSYADLPAEAKAVCERQSKRLVGEGRAFKDMAAWQAHYVEVYFANEG